MISFFLYYIFTIISGGDSVDVFISDDLETDCNRWDANGCLLDVGIIVNDPFAYNPKGCTLLMHEIYHWQGYREHEIPLCERSQEFRK